MELYHLNDFNKVVEPGRIESAEGDALLGVRVTSCGGNFGRISAENASGISQPHVSNSVVRFSRIEYRRNGSARWRSLADDDLVLIRADGRARPGVGDAAVDGILACRRRARRQL